MGAAPGPRPPFCTRLPAQNAQQCLGDQALLGGPEQREAAGAWKPPRKQAGGGSRDRLPGNGAWGFPHIIVNVLFLLQVTLVGFDSEQELPGAGHVCDFALLLELRDVLCGGLRKGREAVRRGCRSPSQNSVFSRVPVSQRMETKSS